MRDRDPLPWWRQGRVTLLGDAAHPMYPMGSNGAEQAILDAACLSRRLASHRDPAGALRAYQDDRPAATSDVVLRNRTGGPERVIDEVERRAPEGFSILEDVIDAAAPEADRHRLRQGVGLVPGAGEHARPVSLPAPGVPRTDPR